MWDEIRRKGKPRTEEERKARHKRLYGEDEVPLRGSGIKFKKEKINFLE